VISTDGGEAQQLTKTENDVNALEWAPDSKRIAFSTTDPDTKATKDRKEKYGEYSVVHADYQMAIFGASKFREVARHFRNRNA